MLAVCRQVRQHQLSPPMGRLVLSILAPSFEQFGTGAMKTLFSTADVHPRDRFALWHEVACKTVVGHDSQPQHRLAFEASIQCQDVAGMSVLVFQNSAMTVDRTHTHISQTPDDCVFVCQQLSGELCLEQLGRQVILEVGDVTLVDAQHTYHGNFRPGSKLLALKVPRAALHARCGDLTMFLTQKASFGNGISRALSMQLFMLRHGTGISDASVLSAVREYTLDLIALSLLRGGSEEKPFYSTAGALALSKLRATIEMHLNDPQLNATAVAKGAGISVRYANALLANQGTSIIRLINERRLERCRTALIDPLQRHRTISDVAFGWGYSEISHFSKLFKRRFGMTPRDYRNRALSK